MGEFISLSAVVGHSQQEVANSLSKFAKELEGGFESATLQNDHPNKCLVAASGSHTSVIYPWSFEGLEEASSYLSKELGTSVFACHIHDGDLWMFTMYHNGAAVTQFNPIPEYWEGELSEAEMNEWRGDANVISKYLSSVKSEYIQRYFKHWDMDEEPAKAYKDDEYTYGDCWQLFDFLKKVGFENIYDKNGQPQGISYQIWTKDYPLEVSNMDDNTPHEDTRVEEPVGKKPWWKVW